MMALTVMRGFSEAYGSWNTIWILRRRLRMADPLVVVTSCPRNFTDPAVGGRAVVDGSVVGLAPVELIGEMAGRVMAGSGRLDQRGYRRLARRWQLGILAAGMEGAARRHEDERRRLAFDAMEALLLGFQV